MRLSFKERIKLLQTGEMSPPLTDINFSANLRALGSGAVRDNRLLDMLIDCVNASEESYADLGPDEYETIEHNRTGLSEVEFRFRRPSQ